MSEANPNGVNLSYVENQEDDVLKIKMDKARSLYLTNSNGITKRRDLSMIAINALRDCGIRITIQSVRDLTQKGSLGSISEDIKRSNDQPFVDAKTEALFVLEREARLEAARELDEERAELYTRQIELEKKVYAAESGQERYKLEVQVLMFAQEDFIKRCATLEVNQGRDKLKIREQEEQITKLNQLLEETVKSTAQFKESIQMSLEENIAAKNSLLERFSELSGERDRLHKRLAAETERANREAEALDYHRQLNNSLREKVAILEQKAQDLASVGNLHNELAQIKKLLTPSKYKRGYKGQGK